jgi:endo-1,4-beta-xylanase
MLVQPRAVCFACLIALSFSFRASGQSINGSSLSYRSSGDNSGTDWVLDENGYVGTFFTLAAPGTVTLSVNAAGSTTDAVRPRMNLVVADTKASFDVASGFASYEHTFDLPAGTYFARTEFTGDAPTADRQLTIRNLSIAGAAAVSNSTSTTTNNANSLSAADTYIEHFRRGPARLALVGAAPGAQAEVRMVRNAFNFGTMVQGFDANVFLAPLAPGDTTSTAARYQNFVNNHFNILVPSNMGKWQPNENVENAPTMGHVDTILNYAQSHDMNVRMHNLIWGNQQPPWVNDLIADAQSSNPAIAAQAKADLMDAVSNRIAYYVGDGDADVNDGDRARKYQEIDVLNETLREGTYWDVFGAAGVAEIYKRVQDAVVAAGADTRLYTNEYNIFQFANEPNGGAADSYANWYRRHVEEVNNAGFGDVVTGIGVQYAVDARTSNTQVHSPARMQQVLQNLSVTGLPISLTEFSVHPNSGGVVTTEQRSAQIYNETLRMLYGSPQATSFLIWEAWPPATTDNTNIFDSDWNLRDSGEMLVDLLNAWTTPTQTLAVGPDGTIDFTGFYGDYEISIGGRTLELSIVKGIEDYSLVVAVPGDFDDDFDVDAADLTHWRTGYGVDVAGDADGDGDTDGNDFLIWQRNLGHDSLQAVATQAPEPTGRLMALVAACLVHRFCRPGRAARRRSDFRATHYRRAAAVEFEVEKGPRQIASSMRYLRGVFPVRR